MKHVHYVCTHTKTKHPETKKKRCESKEKVMFKKRKRKKRLLQPFTQVSPDAIPAKRVTNPPERDKYIDTIRIKTYITLVVKHAIIPLRSTCEHGLKGCSLKVGMATPFPLYGYTLWWLGLHPFGDFLT